MSLSASQIQIIRSCVPALQEHGVEITKSMYQSLLEEHPDLNNVFNQANQANGHQAQALAGSLAAYATHIDDLGVLSPAVERICHKHASLYIQPGQYEIVGEHLLRAMQAVLGAALTPAALEAWKTAYSQLADLMIGIEAKLLQDTNGWTDWRDMRIADKQRESGEITSFYLVPVDGKPLPPFLPGQYVSVMTDVPALRYMQARQYSLSDAPHERYYRISVKKDIGLDASRPGARTQPGYLSNILHDGKVVGDTLKISHPEGVFALNPEDAAATGPVVLLSAGVGLTPMIAILNTLVQRRSRRRVAWIHGTRSTAAQAFGEHVKRVVEGHENVHAVVFNKQPDDSDVLGRDYHRTGRLSLCELDSEKDLFVSDGDAVYYVCGPETFMVDVARGLRERGVAESRIRLELFGTGGVPA